jgi:hypothetical protein
MFTLEPLSTASFAAGHDLREGIMSGTILGPGAHGGLVGEVQRALLGAGCDPQGLDGFYGANTGAAVRVFQQGRGLDITGIVSEETWLALLQQPVPPTAVRCLELTAAFEGHDYTLAVGNFDGAWLTWGIIGFTLRHGEIRKILLEIGSRYPELLARAFGDNAALLLNRMYAPRSEQQRWAESLTVDGRLAEPWRTSFATLGGFPEVVAIQRRVAHDDYFLPALATARRYRLRSRLGLALCFDIQVQNGGMPRTARRANHPAIGAQPDAGEALLRRAIANAVADSASARWSEDVRSRKLTIANGRGIVHEHEYILENWGLSEAAAPELIETDSSAARSALR